MDAELAVLVSNGTATIAQLLAADDWQHRNTAVRSHRQSMSANDRYLLDVELDRSCSTSGFEQPTELQQLKEALVARREDLLAMLLAGQLLLADVIRGLLDDELGPASATSDLAAEASTRMSAKASVPARVYQADRDQHITEA